MKCVDELNSAFSDINFKLHSQQDQLLRLRNRLLNKQELRSSRLICISDRQVSMFSLIVSPLPSPSGEPFGIRALDRDHDQNRRSPSTLPWCVFED